MTELPELVKELEASECPRSWLGRWEDCQLESALAAPPSLGP